MTNNCTVYLLRTTRGNISQESLIQFCDNITMRNDVLRVRGDTQVFIVLHRHFLRTVYTEGKTLLSSILIIRELSLKLV